MLSRRFSAKSKRVPTNQPCLEPLERRQMLTALINGVFQGTGTIWDGGSVFEYRQANGNSVIRISVNGNITAEFIGAFWDPTQPSQVSLTDLVPATVQQSNVFLFSIYVVKSDMNSTISIAEVPELTATSRPMQPFANGPSLRYTNAWTGASEVLTLQDGGAYIGLMTPADLQAPANSIPIIRADQRAFGMRPASAGTLYAGLEVAPGNDLGKFYLGGTITGIVNVPGSMHTFYAGNILTGDASGISYIASTATLTDVPTKNFHIGKDIRNLLSANSFGTAAAGLGPNDALEEIIHKTGFELDVVGRIGQIKAGDSFLGQAVIRNVDGVRGPGAIQQEVEVRGVDLPNTSSASYFDPFYYGNEIGIGEHTLDPRFFNDSFDTAQWLGTAYSQGLKSDNVIQLAGWLDNFGRTGQGFDVDYYAVGMLAGQTFQVQLVDELGVPLLGISPRLGIFDPDGRLIATDYSNIALNSRVSQPIRITADRPGSYRIVISAYGDVNFNGVIDGGEGITAFANYPYQLRITSTGDLALGGLVAANHIATMDLGSRGINVHRGDVGEINAGGTIFSESNPWYITSGNLRAVVAASMSILRGPNPVVWLANGPDFYVRKGSIGLLRTTNADQNVGMLSVNDNFGQFHPIYTDDLSDVLSMYPQTVVGGNIQLVDAAAHLEGTLVAKGAIGTIRVAGGVATLNAGQSIFGTPPVWVVNADHSGSDGVIDLIDVAGSLFRPAIATGPNGNVRYMRIGGTLYRDVYFGGGTPEPTLFAPGETAYLTDDSGTAVALTPIPLVRNPNIGLGQPQYLNPGQLSVLTYPIRDKAGVVIVNVTVIPPVSGQATGLRVTTGSRGPLGTAEISQITVNPSAQAALTFDVFNRTYTYTVFQPPAGDVARDVDLLFEGDSRIDVWTIDASPALTFNRIINSTSGEIVNINGLPDVNILQAETVGLSRSTTGAVVEGVTVQDSVYPFRQQRNLINVGDLASVSARRGLGNILAGNIGTITPNSDNRDVKGVFEGINAPIVARHPAGPAHETGNIVTANIGEGIAPSGTGDVGFSGLYAEGVIDTVRGLSVGADIRGDIVANGTRPPPLTQTITDVLGRTITQSTPTYIIGNIRLNGGSIVDADILTPSDNATNTGFEQAREFVSSYTVATAPDSLNDPVWDINSIRIDGIGGILGAFVMSWDVGLTQINGGFGVINSFYLSGGGGVFQGIVTDGYGIRNTIIQGGANLQTINARGTGKRISTTWYSSTVRLSEKYTYDPASGIVLDSYNDLHKFLGTTAASPKRKGMSEAGIIQDCQFIGSRDLGSITAHRIVVRNPFVYDPVTRTRTRIPIGDASYPMRISFANSTGTINVRDVINGLSLTTGGIRLLSAGGDIANSTINVAGRVRRIQTGSALRGTTTINVTGPDGQLDYISTKASLYARINVSQNIGTLKVGTYLGSPLVRTGKNMNLLDVRYSILTGATVVVRKTLYSLVIGKDLQDGARIQANNIKSQSIGGQVLGDIVIL